jgi:hypothetical protein
MTQSNTTEIWLVPDSGHLRRNPINPDFDETVRILAFIPKSGNGSRNPAGK